MIGENIFPVAAGDGCEPFRAIASRIRCDENDVHAAFNGLDFPEWDTPAHLDAVKKVTHSLNEASRHADNLLRAMRRLSQHEREDLIISGAVTFQQVEFLRDVLAGNASDLKSWSSRRYRGGGRNPAAYIVAEGIRRLFRRLRKPITFGIHSEGGPSTDFGRAVEYAIGAFGIHADWRRPTEEAANKQVKIRARLARCSESREQAERLRNPVAAPDLSGIEIRSENVKGRQIYVISLTGNPAIPSLRVDGKKVSSGRDVADFAYQWATSVRAAMT